MSSRAPLTILIAGASGMIGAELQHQLVQDGHSVIRLVRHAPRAGDESEWSPSRGSVDPAVIEQSDAVINLSGASLSHLPWTSSYKKQILDSRVDATRTLADAIARSSAPPGTLISGSAVGFYGDRPNERLTESAPAGLGFLPDVVASWEAAAARAGDASRVVTARTGVVIGKGGALKPLLPIARLGLAGPLGSGKQFWPWISLYDEAAAIRWLLTSTLSGAVNLVGPTPATASEVIRQLARAIHRPYGVPVPAWVLTTALRDAGRELLLASQNVVPERLEKDGFFFAHPTIAQAIDWLVDR